MKVSNRKGIANQTGPESCVTHREVRDEALTGEPAGQPLSCESFKLVQGADAVSVAEGNTCKGSQLGPHPISARLAEGLLWKVLDHLQKLISVPGFATGRRGQGLVSTEFSSRHSCGRLCTIALTNLMHRLSRSTIGTKPPPSFMCVLTCRVYCHALSWSNRQRPPTVFAPRKSVPESNRTRSLF